jgi:hypothetical protein
MYGRAAGAAKITPTSDGEDAENATLVATEGEVPVLNKTASMTASVGSNISNLLLIRRIEAIEGQMVRRVQELEGKVVLSMEAVSAQLEARMCEKMEAILAAVQVTKGSPIGSPNQAFRALSPIPSMELQAVSVAELQSVYR